MCREMEEVRAEGRKEGRKKDCEEARNHMLDALLLHNSEDSLLHGEQVCRADDHTGGD